MVKKNRNVTLTGNLPDKHYISKTGEEETFLQRNMLKSFAILIGIKIDYAATSCYINS